MILYKYTSTLSKSSFLVIFRFFVLPLFRYRIETHPLFPVLGHVSTSPTGKRTHFYQVGFQSRLQKRSLKYRTTTSQPCKRGLKKSKSHFIICFSSQLSPSYLLYNLRTPMCSSCIYLFCHTSHLTCSILIILPTFNH